MNSSWLIAALPTAGAIAAAWFTYRQATRVAQISQDVDLRKVEAGAYERARALYESGISLLEEQISRLRAQLVDEQNVSTILRHQIYELEGTVSKLRSQLIQAGIILTEAPSGRVKDS